MPGGVIPSMRLCFFAACCSLRRDLLSIPAARVSNADSAAACLSTKVKSLGAANVRSPLNMQT
jgi:hypothetical protein